MYEMIKKEELAGSENFYAYYGYKQEDANFINAILTGEKPLCTIDDAAKSMELCEKFTLPPSDTAQRQ